MATGMITRHFDHPGGDTAVLEMPAGWSRNCYFVLTVFRLYDNIHTVRPERVTCNTPEEARQRAIERERAALANGWRPRMASRPSKPTNEIQIFRPSGERLPLLVRNLAMHVGETYPPHIVTVTRRFEVDAICEGSGSVDWLQSLRLGERILIRGYYHHANVLLAGLIQKTQINRPTDAPLHTEFTAVQVESEPGEEVAIERFHSREQVILDLLDDPDPSIHHLYQEISKRVQEPADRPQVQQEILRRRAELQAAEIREREAAVSRERAAAEAAVARTLPTRPRQQATFPAIQQDVKAAMRRLAGGQDLGAPKRRKIDLGE